MVVATFGPWRHRGSIPCRQPGRRLQPAAGHSVLGKDSRVPANDVRGTTRLQYAHRHEHEAERGPPRVDPATPRPPRAIAEHQPGTGASVVRLYPSGHPPLRRAGRGRESPGTAGVSTAVGHRAAVVEAVAGAGRRPAARLWGCPTCDEHGILRCSKHRAAFYADAHAERERNPDLCGAVEERRAPMRYALARRIVGARSASRSRTPRQAPCRQRGSRRGSASSTTRSGGDPPPPGEPASPPELTELAPAGSASSRPSGRPA